MIEIKLCYNPFKVEMELFIKSRNKWNQVSAESGLLRVSKMRMQHWLEPVAGQSYFDELRDAVGDNQIIIYFSGTTEDMYDLKNAVKKYCEEHSSVNIEIKPDGNTERNSSKNKLNQLRDIVNDVKNSDFRLILPSTTLSYLDTCLYPNAESVIRIPFEDSPGMKELFCSETWQMFCLIFAYEDMLSESNRKLLKNFSKELDKIDDRNFERERFLFLCTYKNFNDHLNKDIHKLFSEYGLWDMKVIAINEQDLSELDNFDSDIKQESFVETQRYVRIFQDRYADQYRLRKMHDVLEKTMRDQGYCESGSALMRKVDEIQRGGDHVKHYVSDKTVQEATNWIEQFKGNIEHLIAIDRQWKKNLQKGNGNG